MKEGYKNVNEMLHFLSLPYVSKIICTELISRHYNNFLADHFGIVKTQKLVAQKYY